MGTTKKKGKYSWFKRTFAKVNKISFFACMTISIILIITAFFVPPTAIIDASVIGAVGEIFAWGALVVVIEGIKKGRSVTMTKGDTSLTLNDDGVDDGDA